MDFPHQGQILWWLKCGESSPSSHLSSFFHWPVGDEQTRKVSGPLSEYTIDLNRKAHAPMLVGLPYCRFTLAWSHTCYSLIYRLVLVNSPSETSATDSIDGFPSRMNWLLCRSRIYSWFIGMPACSIHWPIASTWDYFPLTADSIAFVRSPLTSQPATHPSFYDS